MTLLNVNILIVVMLRITMLRNYNHSLYIKIHLEKKETFYFYLSNNSFYISIKNHIKDCWFPIQ